MAGSYVVRYGLIRKAGVLLRKKFAGNERERLMGWASPSREVSPGKKKFIIIVGHGHGTRKERTEERDVGTWKWNCQKFFQFQLPGGFRTEGLRTVED